MKRMFITLTAICLFFLAGCSRQETEAADYRDNGLPVIELTIDPEEFKKVNESPDHSYRAGNVSLSIDIPEGYVNEYSQDLSDLASIELDYFRGRGHGTWEADKKPYRFKLKDKEDLLGMGANKHWVLLANRYDASLLRNRIIAYMGERMGMDYVPKSVPVDLVINGEYYGSYVLSEQVRIDKNRIEIDELKPEDITEPAITGGYLVCLNPDYDEALENIFYSDRLVRFGFESPQFTEDEDGVLQQKEYMSDFIQECEDAIFADEADSYMDLESAADYWWIQEYSGNHDAFITSSTYLYKERSGKLYWGPLWDFDLSLGGGLDAVDGFMHRNMIWLDHMRGFDEDYQQLLKERWKVLDGIIDEITEEGGIIDQYAEEIAKSYEDDQRRWAIIDEEGNVYRYDLLEEADLIRDWMKRRQEWINANIDDVGHVYETVTFMVDGEVFKEEYALMERPLDTLPEAPYKEGYIFSHWQTEDGTPYEYAQIMEDTVLDAVYLDEDEAGITEAIFFVNPHDAWARITNKVYEPIYELLPEGSIDRNIIWTSSDPEIATIDERGTVRMKKTGEVRIDAKLQTGAEDSFTLHIYDPLVEEIGELKQLVVEEEMILKENEYSQIKVTLVPSHCDSNLIYTIDDEDVATVDYFGVVHGLKKGETIITVKDASSDMSATVKIIVE